MYHEVLAAQFVVILQWGVIVIHVVGFNILNLITSHIFKKDKINVYTHLNMNLPLVFNVENTLGALK